MLLLAQKLQFPGTGSVEGPIPANSPLMIKGSLTVGSILAALLKYVLPLAGIGLLVVILSAGFTLLTSGGDTKAMDKGKAMLTNGILGFVIIFAAYWIVQLAGIVFGIEEIKQIFK